MTLANDSILVTPGSGASVATHIPPGSAVEHQVVMLAGDKGHIHGSKPSYLLWIPGGAVGASKLYFDLFNAVGTGKVIEINGLWAVPKTDVAIVGVLAVEIGVYRTSAVGTGGTAASNPGTALTTPNFTPKDTNNPALPAGVTCRAVPTAGATIAAALFGTYVFTEETSITSHLTQFFNMLPASTLEIQPWTLNEGQGLLVKQGTVAGLGSIGFLLDLTVI